MFREECWEVEDLASRVARLETRADAQEAYQERQNGAIERLATQYESLQKWLVGLLGAALLNLGLQVLKVMGGGR